MNLSVDGLWGRLGDCARVVAGPPVALPADVRASRVRDRVS